MQLGEIIIIPCLQELFLFPNGNGNMHFVLQNNVLICKTGNKIHIYQNATAGKKKALIRKERFGKNGKGSIDRIFPLGDIGQNRLMSGGTKQCNIPVKEADVYTV